MAGISESSVLFDLILANLLKPFCDFLVGVLFPSSASSPEQTDIVLSGKRSFVNEEPRPGPLSVYENVGHPDPCLDIANNPFLVVVTPIPRPSPNKHIPSTSVLSKPEGLTPSSSTSPSTAQSHRKESIYSTDTSFTKGSTPNFARFLPGSLLNFPEDVSFLPRKRCSAFTRDRQRCDAYVDLNEDQVQDLLLIPPKEVTVYCGRSGHHKQTRGYSVRANLIQSDHSPVNAIVPNYISERTKLKIESKLLEPPSSSDKPGVLYILEINGLHPFKDESRANTIKYKVGRTDNLERRMAEWVKRCGAQMTARYQFPNDGGGGSPMRGMIKKGGTMAWVHKVERLVHLELQDLIRTEIYLDSQWPDATLAQVVNETNRQDPQGSKCPNCGARHREVFEFKRLHGIWAKREWEFIIKPIIERWAHLVNQRAITLEGEASGPHQDEQRSESNHDKDPELMD